uniref:non-specific serine/threonine protein kinase n=2 Tax=Auxenochlorella protothecoides TaxID=3075 RepID=A0A1D1ZQ53_AUXPR
MCLKLHRLGRTSFRAVKSKRDYLRQGSHYSWLYLSRLSAVKEFAFMRALQTRGLPVPEAIDQNRHAVLMSLVDAFPLVQIKELASPARIYTQLIDLMERLAQMGLVHCDFNEFNILINEEEEITLIDFPQMVSTNHANAEELFERDVDCLIRFFSKKLGYVPSLDSALKRVRPNFQLASPSAGDLDSELRASGFKREHQAALDSVAEDDSDSEAGSGEEEEEEESSSEPECEPEASSSSGSDGEEEEDSEEEASEEEADTKAGRASPAAVAAAEKPREGVAEASGKDSDNDDAASLSTVATGILSMRISGRPTPAGPNVVADTLRQQQKRAARRAAMASASRNAMKGRNKGKRKGEGADGGGGGLTWG